MKRGLFTFALAALTIGLLGSCSKINERIDGLDNRVYDLENAKIASVEQQIAAINQSIADLETIRTNIQNLKNEQEAQGQDITALKAADITLEGKINDLKTYVDTELSKYATKDWANATFATLEQHQWTCDTIAKIDARIGALDAKLSQSISGLENSLKKWVNEQLDAYYTAAQMDAKLGVMQSEIDALKNSKDSERIDSLATELTKTKAAVDTAKANIRTEYKNAIDVAINKLDGEIRGALLDSIAAVNGRIEALDTRVTTLEGKVLALEGKVDKLLAMIQSVSITPAYSDGSVEAVNGILTLKCIVSPAEAIIGMESLKDSLLIYADSVKVKTKATTPAYMTIKVSKASVLDAAQGAITLTADISEYLPKGEDKALTIAVNIKNGISDFTTEFVPVTVAAANPIVAYVEIAAKYDGSTVSTLRWYRQSLAITESGKKAWTDDSGSAVKVPGTNDDVIVGDYFPWGTFAGFYGSGDDSDKGLLPYSSFTSTGCGDGSNAFTFKDGKQFNRTNTPYWSGSAYTKYNATDKKTELDASDDVASIILGGTWRIPTKDEIKAMKEATYWAWDATDKGYYVYAPNPETDAGKVNNDGTGTYDKADALLFFPATGNGNGTSMSNAGTYGYYRSSTLCSEDTECAYRPFFDGTNVFTDNYTYRYFGFSVRPVQDPAATYKAVTGVTFDVEKKEVVEGGNVQLSATVTPADATNKGVYWTSSDTTVAKVDALGKVTAVKEGTATITATTVDGSETATCTVTVLSPKPYVEIAAKYDGSTVSTLRWYTQSLAITGSGKKAWTDDSGSPVKVPGTGEDVVVGDYFQWGTFVGFYGSGADSDKGLLPYTEFTSTGCGDGSDNFTFKDGKQFNQTNAPYWSGSAYTKYNATDKKTELDASDDVASIILGGTWRMPTTKEFQALKEVTYWAWDATDKGYYVYTPNPASDAGKVNDGTGTYNKADALLFFPVAGNGYEDTYYDAGYLGDFWTGSLYSANPAKGCILYLNGGEGRIDAASHDSDRYRGYSVRPVQDPKATYKAVTSVSLNETSKNITVGGNLQLKATVIPDDATQQGVYWTSSAPTVATVDATGKVTAVAAGTATITATTVDGSKTTTCTVTVVKEVKTMAEILNTATGIPESQNLTPPANAWVNSTDPDCKAFVGIDAEGDKLFVILKEGSGLTPLGICMDDEFEKIDDNTYKRVEESVGTFTIKMTEGKFTSYEFTAASGSASEQFNGTYSAPVSSPTFKAVYDTNGGANTLTFYYDANDHSGEGTVYEDGTANYLFDNSQSNGKKWGYNGNRSSITSVVIDASVAGYKGLTSTAFMFQGMTTATNISGAEYLDVSNVTDMSWMFQNFGGGSTNSHTTLNSVPDVSKWNTANVTNMTGMFNSYGNFSDNLTIVPDVSNWNTANVTNMANMFQKYGHESTGFNAVPDVSKWNTGKVEDMHQMFIEYGHKSTALTAVPDVCNWNTAEVKTMAEMFREYGASSTVLKAVPDVSGWNTGKVTTVLNMFQNYGNGSVDFVLDLSGWDLSKITSNKGDNVFDFTPNTFNVTIPAKTGEKSNEGGKWYYGDGTNHIEPPTGKTFTLPAAGVSGNGTEQYNNNSNPNWF